MAVRLSIRLRVLVFLPEPRSAGRSHHAPSDQGSSSLACGKWRYLMPEVGGVRFLTAARICCCMPYASVYVCLYACLHCLGPAMQVGRTTPGRPVGEIPSWRHVASSHARGRACEISQLRTHMLLYAFCNRLRVLVFLPEPRHAGRSYVLGRPGASSPAGGKWRSLTPGFGVCDSPTPHA